MLTFDQVNTELKRYAYSRVHASHVRYRPLSKSFQHFSIVRLPEGGYAAQRVRVLAGRHDDWNSARAITVAEESHLTLAGAYAALQAMLRA